MTLEKHTLRPVENDAEKIAKPAKLKWETILSCLSVAAGLMSVAY